MLGSAPQWLGRAAQSGGEAMTRNALAWLGDAEAWLRIAQQRGRIGIAWACEGKALDSDDQRWRCSERACKGIAELDAASAQHSKAKQGVGTA